MVRAVAVAVMLLLFSAMAAAAPSPQALKEAKAHFAAGKALQDKSAWEPAIAEYEAAYKLAPLPALLFNIGQCQRLKGDKLKALEAYQAFLAAAPDDAHADEAREHISTLKLRIEIDLADQRSRAAAAEAELARKQAAEAEASRQSWEKQQTERTRAIVEEQARQRHAAEEALEKDRRERSEVEAAKQRRMDEARRVGRPLLIAGPCIAVGGALIYGLAWTLMIDENDQKSFLGNETRWTTSDDQRVQKIYSDSAAMIGLWTTGAVLLLGGTTMAIIGRVKRSRAIDRAERQP